MSLTDHPAGAARPSVTTGLDLPSGPDFVAARPERSSQRTRTSGAWAAITVGLTALIVVLVFVLQNLKSVEVTFLGMHLHLPLAILMLLVAALGAVVVFAFSAARIFQLRMEARRSRRERA